MTIKEWVQLVFGLCNGLSFALTIRHSPKAKIAGSMVLMMAQSGIAVYFVLTHQAVFLLGNAIMTSAGGYGVIRGLRALRQEKADMPEMSEAEIQVMADDVILEKLREHFQTKVNNLNGDEMAEGPFEDADEEGIRNYGDKWEQAAERIDKRGGLRVHFTFADQDGSC